MANELMIPGGDVKIPLPAHIARRFKPEDSNIITSERVPTLSFRGKTFTINADGETTPVTRKDEDGNEFPAPSLSVIILDYAAKNGRAYFEGKFDPNDAKAPVCWSSDSITPDAEVPEETKSEVTSHKCSTCPFSAKGSAITDTGKQLAACAVHRRLAVVPYKRMDLPPLRLQIAQTAIFDGKSPALKEKGMFAFTNYLDSLKARGIPHTQSIVTRLSFDPTPTISYPKPMFTALKFLDDDEIAKVDEILASGKVEELLGETSVTAVKSGKAAATAIAAPKQQTALPAPVKSVVVDEEDPPATTRTKAERDAGYKETAREIDEEAEAMAKLEALRAAKKAKAEAMEAEAEANRKAVAAAAKAKADEAKAATAAKALAEAAAVPEDEMDDEARLMKQLAAARAKKAAAQSAEVTEALKSSVVETEAPKAEAANGNGAKRTRRTKEQIAADEAKATKVAAVGGEKFLPKALDGSSLGDDDEGGDLAPAVTTAPVKNGGGAAAPKAQAISATEIPDEAATMLTTWDD